MDSEAKPENYGTIWSQPQKQKGRASLQALDLMVAGGATLTSDDYESSS
jgi:hypothetical protein